MVEISVADKSLHLEVQGWDKLWAFKSSLTIPLQHVRSVRADPEAVRKWRGGIRLLGTQLPGVITAGTYYKRGQRIFWDVHKPENTIVLELTDDRYDQLIIEVTEPRVAIEQIKAALSQSTL